MSILSFILSILFYYFSTFNVVLIRKLSETSPEEGSIYMSSGSVGL